MGNGRYGEAGISRNVESHMGRLLNKVREKNKPYENEGEYAKESDSDEQEHLWYYDDDDYLDDPLGKWEVRYDNQAYIQSMVNEDKGLHRITDYPKQKWEVAYDDRSRVKNLEPYPVRVSIDYGDDEMAQWDIPYDNKNFVLSMLAGSGISKTYEKSLMDIERVRERHGNLRNPYDYDYPQDEVIYSPHREKRSRRDSESYRFDRVERNVHDYEAGSIPEDEVTRPHVRDQRRRSTKIYRYGDVERNVHDVANQYRYSRSPPRPGISTQKGVKTRYDTINRWKNAMRSPEYEKQNAYNEDLERHYNQYGVEASAHDYDESRAIRTTEARKRIVPMSFVNVMKSGNKRSGHLNQPVSFVNVMKSGNKRSGRLNQVVERFRSPLRDKVPVHRRLYERVAEDYDDIPAPANLYEDVVEEHEDHPYDYGTTHENAYKEYKEGDDGSQTWMTSNEKFGRIHHRSQ